MSLPRFNGAFKLQVSHSWLSPARLLGHLQMELSAGARNLVVSAPLWLCASVWHTRLQLLWALTISLTLLWGRKTTCDIGSGQRYLMICVTFLHVVPVKKTHRHARSHVFHVSVFFDMCNVWPNLIPQATAERDVYSANTVLKKFCMCSHAGFGKILQFKTICFARSS